jgi:hypothetical protein
VANSSDTTAFKLKNDRFRETDQLDTMRLSKYYSWLKRKKGKRLKGEKGASVVLDWRGSKQ